MVTPLPPRRSGDGPGSADPAGTELAAASSATPAFAPTSAPIPEWVRHFTVFPRLEERLLDDGTPIGPNVPSAT
jgi:hypothetical protein